MCSVLIMSVLGVITLHKFQRCLQNALGYCRCYRNDNYSGFFTLAKEATYLQGCLMELYFGKVRRLALQALNHGGYKLHPYPMGDIAKLLLMKESDAEELCVTHGLKTGFDKSTNVLSLQAKQAPFTHSEKSFRHQSSMINRKRASTFFQEVTAGGFHSTRQFPVPPLNLVKCQHGFGLADRKKSMYSEIHRFKKTLLKRSVPLHKLMK